MLLVAACLTAGVGRVHRAPPLWGEGTEVEGVRDLLDVYIKRCLGRKSTSKRVEAIVVDRGMQCALSYASVIRKGARNDVE